MHTDPQCDGWNRIATYSISTSTFQISNSLTWGRDLSGTLEGAGGVGGLLGINEGANSYRVSYDANGNISEFIDGNGGISVHYEYDPFGNVIVATGSYAAANPWRFSTKPVDTETGYSYYGYRFYNPETGRWLNRDPIGENGSQNIYGFVGNRAIGSFDVLGLFEIVRRDIMPASSGRGDKLIAGILNALGGQHTFIKHGSDSWGWGSPGMQKGSFPSSDTLNLPHTTVARCTRSCDLLKYGKAANSPGVMASDDEIGDCLSKTPSRCKYALIGYNCKDWAWDAVKACGLKCK